MMKIKKIKFLLVCGLLTACGGPKWTFKSIDSQEKCESKKGAYWYDNQCWRNFEDEKIKVSEIDSIVDAQMVIIDSSVIHLGGETLPLLTFLPIPQDDYGLLITSFGDKENTQSLLGVTDKKGLRKSKFEAKNLLFDGDILAGNNDTIPKATGIASYIVDEENDIFSVSGYLLEEPTLDTIEFSFEATEAISGAGNSHIEVKGTEAYVSGDLGTKTYNQMKELIKNHPEVKTLVLTQISGSVNDAVNMHTGRLVREAGLNTKVLSTSDIASGGVDLFCAGKERIVEEGAKIGVHSWCCINDLTAIEIPKEHPAHKEQLQYFNSIMGENGKEFYFYTLSAAAFDDVHYMSDEEIKKWKVSTQFIIK